MVSRSVTHSSLTIPNLITLLRILLTPLFIIFLIQGRYSRALLVFILAGVSDLADGLIARTWQQRSRLGSYLDPLADKLLMATSFVTLSLYHQIPSTLTVIVLSRDVIIGLGILIIRLADYPLAIRPTMAGKWTTTFQLTTVGLVLLAKVTTVPQLLLCVFFWITGGLTVISGLQYIHAGFRTVNHAPGNGPKKGPDG